jgi:hypothetical protein
MQNREVIDQVNQGYRMPQPVDCPKQIYEIMLNCWDKVSDVTNVSATTSSLQVPDRRPTFEWLYSFFNDFFISAQPNYQAQAD